MDKASFKLHLDKQVYDKYYQDIEYIDFIGYTESFKTWEHIKDLVQWKGKSVIDVGCFHGYFSFKTAQLGASVLGLDIWPETIEIVEILSKVYKLPIETMLWSAGTPVHELFDMALFLNVLHHFKDQEKTISFDIKCSKAIFEINKTQVDMVSKYYDITKEVKSHRPGRTILLGTKK